MGFYRACAPAVVGDGESTIEQLILEKDKNRPDRVEQVLINDELKSHVERAGFTLDEILPVGINLPLTHRTGRLFGGTTREMLSLLHPSFIPFLEKAARVVDLPVVGFDCIVPDPTEDANAQKWGIIECNTLPFIDLHYYALEGKPKNIAGKIWDLWN
jgi:cyanophycin synthetase